MSTLTTARLAWEQEHHVTAARAYVSPEAGDVMREGNAEAAFFTPTAKISMLPGGMEIYCDPELVGNDVRFEAAE